MPTTVARPRCTFCGREHDEPQRRCAACRKKRKRYLIATDDRRRPKAPRQGQKHGLHNAALASEGRLAWLAFLASRKLPLFVARAKP